MARLVEAHVTPLRVENGKRLSGIFAEMDVFNQNERRYPEDVYLEAYDEIRPKIENRRLLGELDHPLDYDEVRLANVSHVITECHIARSQQGVKTVYGTVELLDTPAGKIAQALVRAGINLGISSRGVGNTRKVSGGSDVTQFKLITWDLVADPSFKNAVLSEDKKSELSESLSAIESKLPLNESKLDSKSIRDTIQRIRESLCSDNSVVETNMVSKEEIQNLEINSLRRVLESKNSQINSDTSLLKRQRKQLAAKDAEIKALKESLADVKSRYTSIRESNAKLQDAYNDLEGEYRLHEANELKKKDAEIVELTKRLAVERRGMSYTRVGNLLEGLSTESEINERLDSISSMNRRSITVSDTTEESFRESLKESMSPSKLSRMISRV